MHKKILLLSTYPIKNPQHGGQKRTAAIVEAYKDHGFIVRHSAVYFRPFYAEHDQDDITLGRESEQKVMQSPLTGDIVGGEAIYQDNAVRTKMIRLLQDFQPDIIHLEQPFTYIGLKPLLQELSMSPKIIFGSQNIEAPMKREILENAQVEEVTIRVVERQIAELETTLSQESDLVVACTRQDLKAHKAMGAKKLVLAANGINQTRATPQAHDYWRNTFRKIGVTKTVLFVGSAHPPNWSGFLDMVGKGIGFLSSDTRLIAAGSISDYFEREINPDSLTIEDATFWLRGYSTGRLSEDRLSALIKQADVILLPITEGGGSNLKTAEAILANKKVVATHHALRSFEWFKDFPNVWVADTQNDFVAAIQTALDAPFTDRTKEQAAQAELVEWRNCLKEMVMEVSKL